MTWKIHNIDPDAVYPTFHVEWDATGVTKIANEMLEKEYIYTADELRSTMESIKTKLILLCEMRGL